MSGATSAVANPARGEATIRIGGDACIVRPGFAALVAAEAETGSLLALAERAAQGAIGLAEIEVLVWHCLADRDDLKREEVGQALVEIGLAAAMPAVRTILSQLLVGGQ